MVEMPMRIEEDECSLQKLPILFTFYSIADNSLHRDTRVRPRPASVRVSIDKSQPQKVVLINKYHSFTTKMVS